MYSSLFGSYLTLTILDGIFRFTRHSRVPSQEADELRRVEVRDNKGNVRYRRLPVRRDVPLDHGESSRGRGRQALDRQRNHQRRFHHSYQRRRLRYAALRH